MFEYVLHRIYVNSKKQLVSDKYFKEKVFDTLDEAVTAEMYLKETDPYGEYYIEHRIKLDYDSGINTL